MAAYIYESYITRQPGWERCRALCRETAKDQAGHKRGRGVAKQTGSKTDLICRAVVHIMGGGSVVAYADESTAGRDLVWGLLPEQTQDEILEQVESRVEAGLCRADGLRSK